MVSTMKGQSVVGQQGTYGYVWCRNMACNREGKMVATCKRKLMRKVLEPKRNNDNDGKTRANSA